MYSIPNGTSKSQFVGSLGSDRLSAIKYDYTRDVFYANARRGSAIYRFDPNAKPEAGRFRRIAGVEGESGFADGTGSTLDGSPGTARLGSDFYRPMVIAPGGRWLVFMVSCTETPEPVKGLAAEACCFLCGTQVEFNLTKARSP